MLPRCAPPPSSYWASPETARAAPSLELGLDPARHHVGQPVAHAVDESRRALLEEGGNSLDRVGGLAAREHAARAPPRLVLHSRLSPWPGRGQRRSAPRSGAGCERVPPRAPPARGRRDL